MTTHADTIDFNDDSISQKERNLALAQLSRKAVNELLNMGVSAEEISYMFAYVATELGLYHTENSFMVFPTVLDGINGAANNAYKC